MSLLVALLLTQSKAPLHAKITELDPKTRPTLGIYELRKLSPVSVSEYFAEDQGKMKHIRAFRYCFKATYAGESKRWKSLYKDSQGWKTTKDLRNQHMVYRRVTHPTIANQAMILHPGRIVFDKKAKAHTRIIPASEWVWVAMYETHKK